MEYERSKIPTEGERLRDHLMESFFLSLILEKKHVDGSLDVATSELLESIQRVSFRDRRFRQLTNSLIPLLQKKELQKKPIRIEEEDLFRAGEFEIEPKLKRVSSSNGVDASFTPNEMRLVVYLADNLGRVSSYTGLNAAAFGYQDNNSGILKTHMTHIRRKLDHKETAVYFNNQLHTSHILNIQGTGYILLSCPPKDE